jgi:hypothetical protein
MNNKNKKIVSIVGIVLILFAIWWVYSTITLGGGLAGYLITLFSIILYFFPTYTAWRKKHNNLEAISIINIFLGWTLIGWVFALVWAVKKQESISSK